MCLADTTQEARERLEQSTFDLFRRSLKETMMKGVDLDKYVADNLIGTPEEICAKVASFEESGLDGFSQRCSSPTPSTKCSSRCGCSRAT